MDKPLAGRSSKTRLYRSCTHTPSYFDNLYILFITSLPSATHFIFSLLKYSKIEGGCYNEGSCYIDVVPIFRNFFQERPTLAIDVIFKFSITAFLTSGDQFSVLTSFSFSKVKLSLAKARTLVSLYFFNPFK
jgi:hypothetical protein